MEHAMASTAAPHGHGPDAARLDGAWCLADPKIGEHEVAADLLDHARDTGGAARPDDRLVRQGPGRTGGGVENVHPRVAGIDVHKKQVTVAVLLPADGPGEFPALSAICPCGQASWRP
jgi:hypothetical protein